VAFSAWLIRGAVGAFGVNPLDRREHRTVVLPDFQGVGIGNRVSEWCASLWRATGVKAMSTTSHPGMIHHRSRSPLWRRIRLGLPSRHPRPIERESGLRAGSSWNRLTAGFEYVGPAMDRAEAEAILAQRPGVFIHRPAVRRVLELVGRYPGISAGGLAKLIDGTTSLVRAALAELIEAGEVVRVGAGGAGGRQFGHFPS